MAEIIIDANGKRFNPLATHVVDGVTYQGNVMKFPAAVAQLGLSTAQEAEAPADIENYFINPQDDAPYVIYSPKAPEQIAQVTLAKAKQNRAATVEAITVTTAAGNTFDGDEVSQGRMVRAVVAMDEDDVTLWILHNSQPMYVARAELREALRLAGEAQTNVWVKPYI